MHQGYFKGDSNIRNYPYFSKDDDKKAVILIRVSYFYAKVL